MGLYLQKISSAALKTRCDANAVPKTSIFALIIFLERVSCTDLPLFQNRKTKGKTVRGGKTVRNSSDVLRFDTFRNCF